jgi:hypothetical protein
MLLPWASLHQTHDHTRDQGRQAGPGRAQRGLRRPRRSSCATTEERRDCRRSARDPLGRRARRRDDRLREPAGRAARKGRAASFGSRPSCGARRSSARVARARGRRRGCPASGEQDHAPRRCRRRQGSGRRTTRCPRTGRDPSCRSCADAGQPRGADARLVPQGLLGPARSAPEGDAPTSVGHESRPPGRPAEAASDASACRSARPGEKGSTATAPATAAQDGLT